ncbi:MULTISPECIES: hypothetical protein [unclassified Nocardioides]|uniref:hypothetical protein n=1 Tax=unclassified Nocardioides TaxID=2615069 RepID=UPI0006FD7C7E|nr:MULTISPECIES: hypothetical protein [unclassified Nocardioides]KQY54577.1 hypothetical protein ASD30_18210 [Nocardioides sp. Root140]KQZ66452.1 hypothetical protein ASD66_23295 [Nocardioides sp. Root151]KRF19674.1 hypothetical protein ASH02_24270 [Nocardioides sp. Soil796]
MNLQDPTRPDAVILLPAVPATMAEVFGVVSPELAAALEGVPPVPALASRVNGCELTLGVVGAPITDRDLLADLSTSPLRATLEPAVAAHRAYATITAPTDDPWTSSDLVSNLVAYLLDDTDAKAVWLPRQMIVNTDVMYVHDVAEGQPERTWFRVHAMQGSAGAATAFTRGLGAFGWPEVQATNWPGGPADAFTALTEALGARVRERRALGAGEQLELAGTRFSLQPGTDVVGQGLDVLDLVPGGASTGPTVAEPARKRGWFRRG